MAERVGNVRAVPRKADSESVASQQTLDLALGKRERVEHRGISSGGCHHDGLRRPKAPGNPGRSHQARCARMRGPISRCPGRRLIAPREGRPRSPRQSSFPERLQ